MNILFTICARAGSKGLKNKNISDFCGKPLCYHTLSVYDSFRKTHPEYVCSLAVNTDSLELIAQIKSYGIPFEYIERTLDLAGDAVSKLDVIRDTYQKMLGNYDILIDLDLTSPLRKMEDIEGVLKTAINNKASDGAFSVTSARRSPYFNQVKKNEDGFFSTVIKSDAVARQQVPDIFDMNASIYAYKASFLENPEMHRFFDGKMLAYEMLDTAVLDIDNQHDKELMEIIAKYWFWGEMNNEDM